MAKYSEKELEEIRRVRARARVDLFFLAKSLLHYRKLDETVHAGIIAACQRFDDVQGTDTLLPSGRVSYQPKYDDPIDLPGPRRRLFLDARGHYKTTIQTICHGIQWILNFPNLWMLLVHATLPQVTETFCEMRDHFRYNEDFRYYFPDFCPQKKVDLWGNSEEFTVPCRTIISGQATVSTAAIEKTKQGSHNHVIKFFDIVGEENSGTPEQLKKTTKKFGLFRDLLVSARYWLDVEGTRYDFSDTYGTILDRHTTEKKARQALIDKGCTVPPLEQHQQWHFYVRGCYKKDLGGKPPTYQPEELDAPYLLDEQGKMIPVFPAINSYEDLEAKRNDPTYGPELFAAQMLNNPVDTGGTVPFPLSGLIWFPERRLAQIKGFNRITVDTAHTIGADSNDSVITTAKWDRMRRCYVWAVVVGKMLPDELINQLFLAIKDSKATEVRIEETMYTAGLRPAIERRGQELGIYPNIVYIKRDTQVTKKDRIINTLQPWYKAGRLRFSENLPEHVKERIRHELTRFPKYSKDDVLDTIADQFQGEEYFGIDERVEDDDLTEEQREHKREKEIERWQEKEMRAWVMGERENRPDDGRDPMTGL